MNITELQEYHAEKFEQFRQERTKMGMSVESIKIENFLKGIEFAINRLSDQEVKTEKPE